MNLISDKIFSTTGEPGGIWKKPSLLNLDKASQYRTKYLWPHSRKYHSPLNPIFLHQLKSIDVLSDFSPLLIRDGLVSLLYFFHRFPTPPSRDAQLLISKNLSVFVPMAWLSNVGYFSFEPIPENTTVQFSPRKLILIYSPVDERQCDQKTIAFLLNSLKETFTNQLGDLQIECVFNPHRMFGNSWHKISESGKTSFDFVSQVISQLGNHAKAITCEEVMSKGQDGSVFVDFNPYEFYYADSFLIQELMSRGSRLCPIEFSDNSDGISIDLSFYHRAVISTKSHDSVDLRNYISTSIQTFTQTEQYQQEAFGFNPERAVYDSSSTLCPKSFEDLAFRLAEMAFKKLGSTKPFVTKQNS